MSRYTGPRLKKLRALGLELPGFSRKSIAKRDFPPGQHGRNFRRAPSEFGRQLREKQKVQINYGLNERQMRNMMRLARSQEGSTGDRLIELLERRLDNCVFRAGLAPTIPAARQIVNHGHIRVNGKRADIPSYTLRPGDTFAVKEASKKIAMLALNLEGSRNRPDWLEVDKAALSARMIRVPTAEGLPVQFDLQLVVEYYSKRL